MDLSYRVELYLPNDYILQAEEDFPAIRVELKYFAYLLP